MNILIDQVTNEDETFVDDEDEEDFEAGHLSCIEPINKLKRMSIRRACRQLGEYKKPYRCTRGQELCCTPSRITETDFKKARKFGWCYKLGL